MNNQDRFTLRSATQADAQAIRALIREVQINPTGLNWQRFIIAVDAQGRLVGCGQVKHHRDSSLELASIAVTPGWRDRGVARSLIERLLIDHPGELYLTCRAQLGPFYERFGFRTIEASEMLPRLRRLVQLVSKLHQLGLLPDGLLVMKRPSKP